MNSEPLKPKAREARVLSKLQIEFAAFFRERLKSYGATSPAQLAHLQKSELFTGIKQDWAKIKEAKKVLGKPLQNVTLKNSRLSSNSNRSTPGYRKEKPILSPRLPRPHTNEPQIIKSEPNPSQTDDLRIGYIPNDHFSQSRQYKYPVVKFPDSNSRLKLPRVGRSNQKGYKEVEFIEQLRARMAGIARLEVSDNVHLVIPHFNKPYEPDILLFDKNLNLYIDIEIDEPYDGYYRFPTHNINSDEQPKKDDIRDQFFNDSGWVVIRFTEKQIHLQGKECIDYVENILHSIYNQKFSISVVCDVEDQWDEDQSIHWQKIYYREKYLDIRRFGKQRAFREIQIDIDEEESIEDLILRSQIFNNVVIKDDVAFDEHSHKYLHPWDQTGNAEFISVTTLIGRFFPFDITRYIERKALEEDRTENELLYEYLEVRDEASDKGTLMHSQIENYLLHGEAGPDSKEFGLFMKFMKEQVTPRNLHFAAAEKRIVSQNYNAAGTIDCLLKKAEKDEFVIVDWKRSKNLIIDEGNPKKYGYGYALSELSHLDNSSYFKYCLQQNIYKYILETEYGLRISSMKLVVLHENYSNYYVVDVPAMIKETEIILNSLKHKI